MRCGEGLSLINGIALTFNNENLKCGKMIAKCI